METAFSENLLFEMSDVRPIPLVQYVRWFIDQSCPDYNLVQLPPIQCGAVWKTGQVERLWDSLLRGFPLGSFLLSPRAQGAPARPVASHIQRASEDRGYFLLDGQQRTRALLLGFHPDVENGVRLWIDLAPLPFSDNADQNDRMFLFRLLTRAQPWGMEWKNPDAKLSEGIKQDARGKLGKTHYDYEIKLDLTHADDAIRGNERGPWRPDTTTSWPLRARMPVPFDALVARCGGLWADQFVRPAWDDVKRLVHPCCMVTAADEAVAKQHFVCVLNALEAVLHGREKRGRAMVTLLRLDPQDDPLQQRNAVAGDGTARDRVQDAIEVLFRRVNAGGTPLVGEEMSFSLLKARWDKAYSLVDEIVRDPDVGYLLSPSGLVLAAARQALTLSTAPDGQSYRDVVQPSVRQFRRWISEPDFLTTIQALLAPVDTNGQTPLARFHTTLQRFCHLGLYHNDGSTPTDPGLPRPLLLSVSPVMLPPVFSWLDQHRDEDEDSRLSVLRYLLFSLFGLTDTARASFYALEVVRECAGSTCFPML